MIDMTEVQNITGDALMYLLTVMKNTKMQQDRKIIWKGNFPKDEKFNQFLRASGFLKYMKTAEQNLIHSDENFEIQCGKLMQGDVAKYICDFTNSKLNQDKLFTKFERLDLEKNITIEGTGLGLAITKKLVELMNGTIVVQSIYGKGSKFTIAIDQRVVHKEVVVENKEEKKVSEVHAEGRKVLIVDDNKINLKVASRLLENYKLDITTVESGALCIDKVNSDTYDLILMDDMMPNMSGVETLLKLKEIDGFATPVVALTANAVTGMKEKYLNDGFDDYLAKPINRDELNNIVAKYLNK